MYIRSIDTDFTKMTKGCGLSHKERKHKTHLTYRISTVQIL